MVDEQSLTSVIVTHDQRVVIAHHFARPEMIEVAIEDFLLYLKKELSRMAPGDILKYEFMLKLQEERGESPINGGVEQR